MRLNTLKPAPGSRRGRKRLGRGAGSGTGSTGGRGHKGQRSRSGHGPKAGFEGGQMPLQRRLPKFGFTSRLARFSAEVRLSALTKCEGDVIDLQSLRRADLIARHVQRVKIIATGAIDRAVTIKGLRVTKGARAAIEQAGGRIEDVAG